METEILELRAWVIVLIFEEIKLEIIYETLIKHLSIYLLCMQYTEGNFGSLRVIYL